jgi:hypothetical protein
MWVYTQTDSTYKISLVRLGELLFNYLNEIKNLDSEVIAKAMLEDLMKLKGRSVPHYLKPYSNLVEINSKEGTSGFNKRQH